MPAACARLILSAYHNNLRYELTMCTSSDFCWEFFCEVAGSWKLIHGSHSPSLHGPCFICSLPAASSKRMSAARPGTPFEHMHMMTKLCFFVFFTGESPQHGQCTIWLLDKHMSRVAVDGIKPDAGALH